MKIAIASLGCAKNLVDTENILGMLKEDGFDIIADESEADVVIVNTCCFINDAKTESIETILDVAQWKQDGNLKKLIVIGCMAQRYKEQILIEMPEVDAVVGVGEYDKLKDVINSTDSVVLCDRSYSHLNTNRMLQTPPYTAYLKIADGCDNHCTYCVIPSIRGRFKSRPIDELVNEAKDLAKEGVKELIVIAQDTTCYGIDLYGECKLAELLEELCKIDGFIWIRLHYCYPERITDELIDMMANNDKICKYIDIPIQHCNNQILKKMGRKSTKEGIINVIEKLRLKIPGITIRTTLITGFPGETDEQYGEMLDFIKQCKFERLGVFAYSCEEGTPASNMDGQIDEEVKLKRQEMLMFAQDDVINEISSSKIGTTVKVLVEGYDTIIKQHYGRTEADSTDIDGKVFFTSKERIPEGVFVDVVIDNYIDYDLFGNRKVD
ncbi:MAG: 30S ribosomal protein S12 methylthiotransferase RimO [Clostridia bacterium]|nr:30S ribosomal protein S12 methylthiotransferase RimO [Clostridia bacterium]